MSVFINLLCSFYIRRGGHLVPGRARSMDGFQTGSGQTGSSQTCAAISPSQLSREHVGKMRQTTATCGNTLWQHVGDSWPFCCEQLVFVPTPSGSR